MTTDENMAQAAQEAQTQAQAGTSATQAQATQAQAGTSAAETQAESTETQDAKSLGSVTRRGFLGGMALFGIGAILGAGATGIVLNDSTVAYAVSGGYLLVDTKKCAGCRTCTLSCSLAHNGTASLSLGRLQIRSNALGTFPNDIAQSQCRQCPYPSCVEACPVGANHIDAATGVRTVDEGKCIGCERCIASCPYTPSRIQWNHEERHAQKCDLCLNTPYWNKEGGAGGSQVCVSVCPMQAIAFTSELPEQSEAGYDVNLRNAHYLSIGLPIDDDAKVVPSTLFTSAGEE